MEVSKKIDKDTLEVSCTTTYQVSRQELEETLHHLQMEQSCILIQIEKVKQNIALFNF